MGNKMYRKYTGEHSATKCMSAKRDSHSTLLVFNLQVGNRS